ncbi:MAG: hypothetical protein GY696_25530, partial [Gammaproteobacteria bacterium]|nr:hypothetical protein [Gammaproteobacteria bacterium]
MKEDESTSLALLASQLLRQPETHIPMHQLVMLLWYLPLTGSVPEAMEKVATADLVSRLTRYHVNLGTQRPRYDATGQDWGKDQRMIECRNRIAYLRKVSEEREKKQEDAGEPEPYIEYDDDPKAYQEFCNVGMWSKHFNTVEELPIQEARDKFSAQIKADKIWCLSVEGRQQKCDGGIRVSLRTRARPDKILYETYLYRFSDSDAEAQQRGLGGQSPYVPVADVVITDVETGATHHVSSRFDGGGPPTPAATVSPGSEPGDQGRASEKIFVRGQGPTGEITEVMIEENQEGTTSVVDDRTLGANETVISTDCQNLPHNVSRNEGRLMLDVQMKKELAADLRTWTSEAIHKIWATLDSQRTSDAERLVERLSADLRDRVGGLEDGYDTLNDRLESTSEEYARADEMEAMRRTIARLETKLSKLATANDSANDPQGRPLNQQGQQGYQGVSNNQRGAQSQNRQKIEMPSRPRRVFDADDYDTIKQVQQGRRAAGFRITSCEPHDHYIYPSEEMIKNDPLLTNAINMAEYILTVEAKAAKELKDLRIWSCYQQTTGHEYL